MYLYAMKNPKKYFSDVHNISFVAACLMMYIIPMESKMTDAEIKKEIRRRRNKKARQRRFIIIGVVAIVAIICGVLLGNKIATNKYSSEVAIKNPVAEDTPLINEAMGQIGNEGGEKFWKWFGFGSRQDWCACFVSWALDSQNYIDEGIAPSFAMVKDGANWFKDKDQWKDGGSTPAPNDLIFFDWEGDGVLDHVGIVTAVVDDKVFTIEGNSSDRCRQKRYTVSDPVIAGYGRIAL